MLCFSTLTPVTTYITCCTATRCILAGIAVYFACRWRFDDGPEPLPAAALEADDADADADNNNNIEADDIDLNLYLDLDHDTFARRYVDRRPR